MHSQEPILIELKYQHDFSNPQDINRVFASFSLESWFTSIYKIRVLDRSPDPKTSFIKTTFTMENQKSIVEILNMYQVQKDQHNLSIKYVFNENNKDFQEENIVNVNMKLENQNRHICIYVKDQSGFLCKKFQQKIQKMLSKSSNPFYRQNQLKYSYIEPQNQRNITFEKPHFSLAFQGGGAKGLAYIGAYQSLKEAHPDMQIKSVIGSSAGSIVALAITAGNPVQQIISMMSQLQHVSEDKVIKSTENLNQMRIANIKRVVTSLRQVLHEYGLIYRQLFDVIVNEVLTDDVIQLLLEVLCDSNPSLRQIFSIQVIEKHPVIQNLTKNVKKLGNYYGFFQAKLLKGTTVQNLAIKIIHRLLTIKLVENQEFVVKVTGCNLKYMVGAQAKFKDQMSRALTMKQLYQLTGIQFTCTAVDLQDKIIRFFNHKTTPNLPAYKAVEMSSSFPIVFEAQRWQQEWGYYYIHYRNKRTELDLTGHRFTDGGVLANFPIKYLDNQKMRAKYFSHKPTNCTKVFGFGLHYVTSEQDSSIPSQVQNMSYKFDKLKQKIIDNFPKSKFIYLQATHCPRDKQVQIKDLPSIKQIPLIQFLLSLFETYQLSNDNLVRECFKFESYIFQEQINLFEEIRNQQIDNLLLKYRKMGQVFSELRNNLNTINYSITQFDKQIDAQKETLKNEKITAEKIIELTDFIRRILVSYGKYRQQKGTLFTKHKEGTLISALQKTSMEFNSLLKELNELYRQPIFVRSFSIKRNTSLLLTFLERIKMQNIINRPQYQDHKSDIIDHMDHFLSKLKQNQDGKIKTILQMIGQQVSNIVNHKVSQGHHSNQDHLTIFNNKLFRYIIQFLNGFQNPFLTEFLKFKDNLVAINLSHLKMKMNEDRMENSMWNYIQNTIQLRDPDKMQIHLVFQGIGNSITYYFHAYNLVNQYIVAQESKKQIALYQKLAEIVIKAQGVQRANQVKLMTLSERRKIIRSIGNNISTLLKKNTISVLDQKYQIDESVNAELTKQLEIRKKNTKRISAITCGNIHSMLGFLICTGFSDDRIEEEMKQFKYLTKVDSDIQEKYSEKDWVNPTSYQMRRLQDKIWEDRYDVFADLEEAIKHDKTLMLRLKQIKYQFNQSKEKVVNGFQEVMDYLVDVEVNRPESQNTSEYLAKKLLLKTNSHNYFKQTKQIANGAQKLIFEIIQMFSDQISLLIISKQSSISPLTERIRREKDPKIKKLIWKGFLIDSFMDASYIKKKIHDLLQQLHLPKDISLKQFYEVAPKKIDLNFLGVDLESQRICFINKNTYPSMAMWAAILISGSYPPLFQKIRGKPQWLENVHDNFREKTMYQVFKDSHIKDRQTPVFISGILLASFPLQLLHNQQVQKKYLKNQKYTFLSFGIKLKKDLEDDNYTVKRSFASLWQVCSLATKAFRLYLSGQNLTPSFDFFAIANKIKILKTYMDSNDQLMLQLYKSSLLLLPIRFNTLDFHKLGDPELIQLTIEETSLMTTQKLSDFKETYFKIKLTQTQFFIYFLSRDLNNKNDATKYNIFYSEPPTKTHGLIFNPIKKQIIGNRELRYVLLKFQFAQSDTTIKQTVYKLSFQTLTNDYQNLTSIYKLNYDSVVNQLVYPKSITHKELLAAEDDPRVKITSIINITTDGLYCERCCCCLSPEDYSPEEYRSIYRLKLAKKQCYHCKQEQMIRFSCPDCSANYCTLCTNHLILEKVEDQHSFLCFRGHYVHYIYDNFMGSEDVFTVCDACREYTEEYYLDEQCNIHICYACAATLIK